jgi:hypothetical protein
VITAVNMAFGARFAPGVNVADIPSLLFVTTPVTAAAPCDNVKVDPVSAIMGRSNETPMRELIAAPVAPPEGAVNVTIGACNGIDPSSSGASLMPEPGPKLSPHETPSVSRATARSDSRRAEELIERLMKLS